MKQNFMNLIDLKKNVKLLKKKLLINKFIII